QKDCAQYDNDPGSKPERSPPFRGWLDIFSIPRCQVIHMQLPLLFDTAGYMQSVLFYSAGRGNCMIQAKQNGLANCRGRSVTARDLSVSTLWAVTDGSYS